MSRLVPLLCLGCVTAIGVSAYAMLTAGAGGGFAMPRGTPLGPPKDRSRSAMALHEARRQCTLPALDIIVQELQRSVTASKDDRDAWHLLAEALLARVQQRSHLHGMAVGQPIYPELPRELADDVEAGLAAAVRARELGDESGELFRIEAGFMGQRITGLVSALQWNGKIQAALEKALQLAKDDPQLHVSLGLRSLLAPKMLGHDPDRALAHFEFAASALLDDERPAVFAAMASYLQKKRQQAVTWLEQAVLRNPNSTFARVVLQRVRRDEGDPFGRNITEAEAAASK